MMEIARARMHADVCAHDDLSPDTKLISTMANTKQEIQNKQL